MATIDYKVFKHHKKNDGTYNVKYCLTHKGKQVYHASANFVTNKDLRKDMTIRNPEVLDNVNSDLKTLRTKISGLGLATGGMTAKNILQNITASEAPADDIDFIAFSRAHTESLIKGGRLGYARTIIPVINNLVDYFETEVVPITWITSSAMRGFEEFMKTERVQVRPGRNGTTVIMKSKPVMKSGINTAIGRIRTLFNECKAVYNTEDQSLITHAPFDFYKVPPPGSPRKRGKDLTIDDIVLIRDLDLMRGSRAELARDIFMLSFYLCGMNAKDIYQSTGMTGGRIEYERSKTREQRDDGAFISIHVPGDALPLLDQYSARYLSNRYVNYEGFITGVDVGIREIKKLIGVSVLTFYHARHVFATLANQEFGYKTSEIAMALNHVDQNHTVTSRYIVYDWSLIDRIQKDVLSLLPAKDPV